MGLWWWLRYWLSELSSQLKKRARTDALCFGSLIVNWSVSGAANCVAVATHISWVIRSSSDSIGWNRAPIYVMVGGAADLIAIPRNIARVVGNAPNIGWWNRASVDGVISSISNTVTVTRYVAGVVNGISDRVRAVVKRVSGNSRRSEGH